MSLLVYALELRSQALIFFWCGRGGVWGAIKPEGFIINLLKFDGFFFHYFVKMICSPQLQENDVS